MRSRVQFPERTQPFCKLQIAPLARCIIMYINQEASSHTSLVFPMVFLISGVVWFAHLMLQIQSSGSGEGSPSSPCGDCWYCYTITVTLDLALLLLTFEMMIISWRHEHLQFSGKKLKILVLISHVSYRDTCGALQQASSKENHHYHENYHLPMYEEMMILGFFFRANFSFLNRQFVHCLISFIDILILKRRRIWECPFGLVVWFILRVDEVPGSIPGTDLVFCCQTSSLSISPRGY